METAYVTIWWITLFSIGLISLPFTTLVFAKFVSAGVGFAKVIGFAFILYLTVLVNFLKILPLTQASLFFVILSWAFANLILYRKNKTRIDNLLKTEFRAILLQEILFLIGFVFWTLVRGYNPDINGLEKFMDFGFVNSLVNTLWLPPQDMWLAGDTINYYWFGHFWNAFIIKITSVPAGVGYNLMLATLMGTVLSGVFTLVSTLTSTITKSKKLIFLAGLVGAILVVFAGNTHTPFYILKNGFDKYWYPDATRFIGYNPDTNDKTIHEFPIYSFVVSDLHAHLINLPFIILVIALLANLFMNPKTTKKSFMTNLFLVGFMLGIAIMTNTWDFFNYGLLTGVALMAFQLTKEGNFVRNFTLAIGYGIGIAGLALLVAFPFLINFQSIGEGVKFVNSRTPIWQLAILWGFPLLLTIIYNIFSIKRALTKADVFVISLLLTGWLLIFLPEIFYVKDIYIASHHRANTMFKLTYQAYVMFYLSAGFVMARLITWTKGFSKFLVSIVILTLLTAVFVYPPMAIKSYYGNLKTYKGLDGEKWLEVKNPEIYEAIVWLRTHAGKQDVILEAAGDSYTEYNSISSYTGIPTVLGWYVHEWLWRGSPDISQKRTQDVETIFNTPDASTAQNLLQTYEVNFVIVGPNEKTKYPLLNEEKFLEIGKIVHTSGALTVYHIPKS